MSETRTGRRIFWIEAIVVAVIVVVIAALILPAIQQAREAARRTQSRNNLKQLGLALENYHDTFELLPPGGTFASDGTPYQSWTVSLSPYLSSSPLYNCINMNRPWDDPVNFDLMTGRPLSIDTAFRDPSVLADRTAAGLPAVHYAPNQWLMHRNSSVRLKDLPDLGHMLLMADAFGGYAGFGDPINWRDATLQYRTSPIGFGHTSRMLGTHVLFADGRVEFVSPSVAQTITAAYAGPESLKPAPELTAQRPEPYRGPAEPPLKYLYTCRGGRDLMRFQLSTDGVVLDANFGIVESAHRRNAAWITRFVSFARDQPIQHVTVTGMLAADELRPFLNLPRLKSLDLQEAQMKGDVAAVLAGAPHVEVIGVP